MFLSHNIYYHPLKIQQDLFLTSNFVVLILYQFSVKVDFPEFYVNLKADYHFQSL
jgi:hypothetical protein